MNCRLWIALLGPALAGATLPCHAGLHRIEHAVESLVRSVEASRTHAVPAAGSLEVAFSPDQGAEALVIKAINAARSEIRGMSYSFSSAKVTQALIGARHRGVAVSLVADWKSNVADDRSGKARSALSALANAGCEVRTIKVYPIHHDKVLVIDRKTVELGSFNYSFAAAHENSENVLVNWDNPALAAVYLEHYQANYRQSVPLDLRR